KALGAEGANSRLMGTARSGAVRDDRRNLARVPGIRDHYAVGIGRADRKRHANRVAVIAETHGYCPGKILPNGEPIHMHHRNGYRTPESVVRSRHRSFYAGRK